MTTLGLLFVPIAVLIIDSLTTGSGFGLDHYRALADRPPFLTVTPLRAIGGYAELIGVEDEKAFVTMGGGCQGCSMSAATLQEGIQRAILEAVPEITEVVDTTDHEQGENPYYT